MVRSCNEHGHEILVMGCGLGFKRTPGDTVDIKKIEKIYKIEESDVRNHLEELLSKVPLEHIQITNEIIEYADLSLGKILPENIYITLTDHINFAIQRFRKGIPIQNALLWEIKRFYNHEYLIGKEAVEMINSKFRIQLPEDEAGFIALHIACATLDSINTEQVKRNMEIIQSILSIVKYHFNIELKEKCIHYERFITHLKFFIQRVFSGNIMKDQEDDFMLMIKSQYKKEYTCALKVHDFFLKEYDLRLTSDEMMYLTIHIRRITSE